MPYDNPNKTTAGTPWNEPRVNQSHETSESHDVEFDSLYTTDTHIAYSLLEDLHLQALQGRIPIKTKQRQQKEPWGHAAHVDSVDSFAALRLLQDSTLPTIAWITLRVLHMTPRPAATFFLLFYPKKRREQPSVVFS
jgi:hypothetical protein